MRWRARRGRTRPGRRRARCGCRWRRARRAARGPGGPARRGRRSRCGPPRAPGRPPRRRARSRPRCRRCRPAAWCRRRAPRPARRKASPSLLVQQGPGVRGGAGGRDAVAPAGREVGRGGEAGEVGRPGGGDGRLLVGAPRAHLDARPVARRVRHPGRRRGDRAVVVEDRQRQRLEQHRLGEGALDRQHAASPGRRPRPRRSRRCRRRTGSRPATAGCVVDHPGIGAASPARSSPYRKCGIALEQPAGAGDHAVPRPSGSRRANTSNTQCRPAVPSRSAAWSMVSS